MTELHKHEKLDALIDRCHGLAPLRTAVAHPCDETALCGAVEAAEAGIIKPVLVGPQESWPRIVLNRTLLSQGEVQECDS